MQFEPPADKNIETVFQLIFIKKFNFRTPSAPVLTCFISLDIMCRAMNTSSKRGDSGYIVKFVPIGPSAPKEFRFSKLGFWAMIVGILVFIASGIVSTIAFMKSNIDKRRLTSLEHENRELKNALAVIQSKIDSLGSVVDSLARENLSLKLMAGIIDSSALMVVDDNLSLTADLKGVGGNASLKPHEEVEREINQLLGLARKEKLLMTYVADSIRRKQTYFDHVPSIMPTFGTFTSGFGYRRDPFTGRIKMHEGLDIAGPIGTPVYATADGIVVKAEWHHGYGKLVEIDHGYGFHTRYGHLHQIYVHVGQRVKRGQKIGSLGNTGRSTGPHLHYEVRINGTPQNPIKFILPERQIVD